MGKLIGDLFADLLLTVLASDLLYLYFVGAWYDPWKWLEILEVVLLFLIASWGIYRFILRVRKS